MTTPSAASVPWQLTGNHWLSVPCIHPADASIHLVSVLHHGSKAALEFAGSPDWQAGRGPALLRPTLKVDGERRELGAGGMAWERAFAWIPSFACTAGDIAVNGTIWCPYSRDTDCAGMVYVLTLENRGSVRRELECAMEGVLGSRDLRVRTSRPVGDRNRALLSDNVVVLEGERQPALAALAIAGEDGTQAAAQDGDDASFALTRRLTLEPGARAELAFYLAAAPERDGAAAAVRAIRARGWRGLFSATSETLAALQQSTGSESLDRLVNRNLVFAYFYSVARALDDAHFYIVHSRAPWSPHGVTIRDWTALMWTIPAVQLADGALARELLLRMFELHGYWPGRGTNYLDGTLFASGFTLEGMACYALSLDRFIRDTGDDRVVEEPVVGETMYLLAEEIGLRRHPRFPLYSTDMDLGGNVAELPFSLHANAVVAQALDVLKRTLDEDSARRVEEPEVVRAAASRHFAAEADGKGIFASSSDLAGRVSQAAPDNGSLAWLPAYDFVPRSDSTYRRTVRAMGEPAPLSLSEQIGKLYGPDGERVLEWLRRAPLDGGVAAAFTDSDGRAVDGRGDAALSGLLAYTVWYAAHVMGFSG
ncbi:MAG TPA: hypothetical protein VKZ41_03175 [Gemmatimonadales bacterium]|nr:hypothetical protein [Gemmatimonadales bacterium]